MMLTQAASLFDTRPPAISFALSLFGAVTKAMENSSKVRPDAIVDTEKRRDVPKLRKGRRMLGINATESTVIYLVRYIKSGFCPDMRTFKISSNLEGPKHQMYLTLAVIITVAKLFIKVWKKTFISVRIVQVKCT